MGCKWGTGMAVYEQLYEIQVCIPVARFTWARAGVVQREFLVSLAYIYAKPAVQKRIVCTVAGLLVKCRVTHCAPTMMPFTGGRL